MQSKLAGVIITAVIGVVILASVFLPVMDGAMTTSGDPVTINNPSFYPFPMSKYDEDKTIVIDSPAGSTSNSTTTITVDGVSYSPSTMGGTIFIQASNWYGFLQPSYNTTAVGSVRGYEDDGTAITANFSFGQKQTIEYAHTTKTTTITTYEYSTDTSSVVVDGAKTDAIYGPAPDGKYSVYRASITDYKLQDMAWGESSLNDKTLVASGGTTNVTVGGVTLVLDYLLSDGVVYGVTNNPQYAVAGTYVITGTPSLIDGTTDLYDGIGLTITFTITNTSTEDSETVTMTPDMGLVLSKAQGHKDSGTVYSLLGVVMICAVIGAVLYVASAVLARRE